MPAPADFSLPVDTSGSLRSAGALLVLLLLALVAQGFSRGHHPVAHRDQAPPRQGFAPLPSAGGQGGPTPGNRPQIAIIIDDMGYNRPLNRKFLDLDAQLSFSFLPEAPYAPELAEEAFRRGRDILVHIPMEPKDSSWQLGVGALTIGDPPATLTRKLAAMLAAVPHATGANNHMGSRFTEQAPGMRVVMESLRRRSLFFIDSCTTPASQGLDMARQLQVPSARRQVFLDTVQEVGPICAQLAQLAAQARKRGQAIAIGHPNQAMLTALSQCGPQALDGLDLVGAHRLVR